MGQAKHTQLTNDFPIDLWALSRAVEVCAGRDKERIGD